MSLTRKETKALLTLLWESCTDAYLMGYNHGANGLEKPMSPYPKPTLENMDNKVSVKDLDQLSAQILVLSKHFQ